MESTTTRQQIHTYIWQSERTIIIAEVNGPHMDWKTFFYFYEISLGHAMAAMPQILRVLDFHLK